MVYNLYSYHGRSAFASLNSTPPKKGDINDPKVYLNSKKVIPKKSNPRIFMSIPL